MQYSDEKDYIMRMIKEMVRVLFSVMLGKKYTQAELPAENKCEVSGRKFSVYQEMVDDGDINEAENLLLEHIDYGSKEELMTAVLFYQYISGKEEEFLNKNNYSKEEALYGLEQLAERTGYKEIYHMIESV